MENRDFARILYETADLMEIAGEDGFRIRSYRNGASAIDGYPERIADILANPERKVTDVPGIGKKTAERLVLELRDKLSILSSEGAATPPVKGGLPRASSPRDALLSALVNMGYRAVEAERAAASLEGRLDGTPMAELVRDALVILAK